MSILDLILKRTKTIAKAKADSAAAMAIIKIPKTCPDNAVFKSKVVTIESECSKSDDGVNLEKATAAITIELNIISSDIIVVTKFLRDKTPKIPMENKAPDRISTFSSVIIRFNDQSFCFL